MTEKRASTQDRLRSSAAVSVLSRRSRRSRRGLQIGSAIGQLPLAKIVLESLIPGTEEVYLTRHSGPCPRRSRQAITEAPHSLGALLSGGIALPTSADRFWDVTTRRTPLPGPRIGRYSHV